MILKDDIHRIKQRHGESFDAFYDSIMILADCLRVPMSDEELCETMIRVLLIGLFLPSATTIREKQKGVSLP